MGRHKDLRFENRKKDDRSSITIVTNQEAKTIEITVLDEKVEALYKLIRSHLKNSKMSLEAEEKLL